ncbi:MAG: hypothetical protein ACK5ZC_15120 [Pirellulaceae bacterium]
MGRSLWNLIPLLVGFAALLTGTAIDNATAFAKVSMSSPGMLGYSVVRPGQQVFLSVEVTNETDGQARGRVIATLEEETRMQFAGEFQLEPGERQRVVIPVGVPESAYPGTRIDAQVRMELEGQEGESEAVVEEGKAVFETIPLYVDPDDHVTLMMMETKPKEPFDWQWRADARHYNYELMVASRVQAGWTRRSVEVAPHPLPTDPEAWDVYDSAILSDEVFLRDAAATGAIQSWVMRGGRLWIVLDQLFPLAADDNNPLQRQAISNLQSLLGGSVKLDIQDDCYLDTIQIETREPVNASAEELNYSVDPPVRMRRVLIEGGEVTHRIGGWPLITWVPLGQGEVLITTMESRGWLREPARKRGGDMSEFFDFGETPTAGPGGGPAVATFRGRKRPPNTKAGIVVVEQMMSSEFAVRPWVGVLPLRLYEARSKAQDREALASAVVEQIGVPVIPRSWMLGFLGSFLAATAALGWWLHRIGHVDRLGWAAPLLAIAMAIPAWAATQWLRKDLAPQWSTMQMVDGSANVDRVDVDATMAIYRPEAGALSWSTQEDAQGSFSSELASATPNLRLASDRTRWSWGAERWPAGVWNVDQRFELPASGLAMRGQWVPGGLELQWMNEPDRVGRPELKAFEDLLVLWPPAQAALAKKTGDGRWLVDADALADGVSWVEGTLLDGRQLLHQKIYGSLFGDRMRDPFTVPMPLVCGWTRSLPTPYQLDPPLDGKGEALWKVPLQIAPPQPGSNIDIPGWMVRARSAPTTEGKSIVFRDLLGKWAGSFTQPAMADLTFELPQSIPGMLIDSATLRLRVLAPERTLSVSSVIDGMVDRLDQWTSPTGSVTVEIPEAIRQKLLDGSLILRVELGPMLRKSEASEAPAAIAWTVESMRMDVKASIPSNP